MGAPALRLAIAVLAVKRVVRPEEIPSAPETSLTFAIGAVRQAATLLTVAGIGGLLYHGLSSEGILAHSAASERIARWQVPKVSVAEVVNAIATSAAPCVF